MGHCPWGTGGSLWKNKSDPQAKGCVVLVEVFASVSKTMTGKRNVINIFLYLEEKTSLFVKWKSPSLANDSKVILESPPLLWEMTGAQSLSTGAAAHSKAQCFLVSHWIQIHSPNNFLSAYQLPSNYLSKSRFDAYSWCIIRKAFEFEVSSTKEKVFTNVWPATWQWKEAVSLQSRETYDFPWVCYHQNKT